MLDTFDSRRLFAGGGELFTIVGAIGPDTIFLCGDLSTIAQLSQGRPMSVLADRRDKATIVGAVGCDAIFLSGDPATLAKANSTGRGMSVLAERGRRTASCGTPDNTACEHYAIVNVDLVNQTITLRDVKDSDATFVTFTATEFARNFNVAGKQP